MRRTVNTDDDDGSSGYNIGKSYETELYMQTAINPFYSGKVI